MDDQQLEKLELEELLSLLESNDLEKEIEVRIKNIIFRKSLKIILMITICKIVLETLERCDLIEK